MIEMEDVEVIEFNGKLFAMVMRKETEPEGTRFYTPKDNPLQLGIIKHEKGYKEPPHIHNLKRRIVEETQETLHIAEGKVKVNFYEPDGKKLGDTILNEGDTILLSATGGHAIEILEDLKGIKVKQGPYISIEEDKKQLGGTDD